MSVARDEGKHRILEQRLFSDTFRNHAPRPLTQQLRVRNSAIALVFVIVMTRLKILFGFFKLNNIILNRFVGE